MIFTAAFMTTALLTAGLSPQTPEMASRARLEATSTLRQALGETEPQDWTAVALATIEDLGPGAFSATLEKSLVDARWYALTDPSQASDFLEKELRRALVDLEFKPKVEAQMPTGFPAPTPVREIEVKRYPSYRRVDADMQGDASNRAFWELFNHIQDNEIAMTAPVEMTYAEDGAAMQESKMAFLYGSPDLGTVGPAGNVEVVDADSGLFLSIGCRGRSNRTTLGAARLQLMAWLESQTEFEIAGELRSMGYNSPMVPNARRYFEVQVPVTRKDNNTSTNLIIDFGAPHAAESWGPVNDSVMGGRSTSQFTSTGEGSCVFEGNVSLENNGGFASARSRPAEMSLKGTTALRLKFRGDGKAYKFRIRTSDSFNALNYELPFRTEAGVWQEQSFPLEDFVPVWRGRRVRDAAQLSPENIRSLGFLISEKQTGSFRLEVGTLTKDGPLQ